VSLVFHRPQSAGELLDVSLGVVKGHPALLFRLGMWPVLGIAAIDLASRALPESSALGLMMLPLSFVVYSIGEAGVSYANARVRNEGYDVEDLFPAATEAAG
jgi:hypothetical protein